MLLLVAAGGAVAGKIAPRPAATTRPTPAPTAASTPTPRATATPSSPSNANSLPGLTPADLIATMQQQGMACSGPQPGNSGLTWKCDKVTNGLAQQVQFTGRDRSTVVAIAAGVATTNPQQAAPFLAQVAGLVSYDGAQPDKAKQWVSSHVKGSGGNRRYGTVQYAVGLQNGAWVLAIYPGI